MNVTKTLTTDYNRKDTWYPWEKQSQYKAKQSQFAIWKLNSAEVYPAPIRLLPKIGAGLFKN